MYGTSAPNGRQSAASPRPPQSLALWYGCGFSAGLLPPGAPYFLSFYISVSFSSYTTCTLSVVREGWDAHNVHVFTWQDQVQYSAHARRIHLPAKQGVFVESWSNTVVIQVASLSPKVLYDGHQYRAPYLRVGHQHLRAQDPWMTDCPCRITDEHRRLTLMGHIPYTVGSRDLTDDCMHPRSLALLSPGFLHPSYLPLHS